MKYQWLLMDADNTLFDFEAAERYALKNTFTECKLPYDAAIYDCYHKINDDLWKQLEKGTVTRATLKILRFSRTADWMKQNGYTLPEVIDYDYMCTRYILHLGACSEMLPGAKALCETLSRHYKLAMVTNGTATVQHSRIEASGLAPYFDYVFISEEIGAEKPSAAFFDKVCQTLSLTDRSKALVIGDSMSSDMKGAYNAGMDACYFNANEPTEALTIRYHVRSFDEMLHLLCGE